MEVTSNLPTAYHENSWTSMVSYRDYIQLLKPIPKYVLNECLNVCLELRHMLNIAVENE